MTTFCVCFTADPQTLFSTLASAVQARAHTSVDSVDVAIYCFSESNSFSNIAEICAKEGILFSVVKPTVIDGVHTAYSRFFLDRILADQYEDFLYLDGDVQITSPLDSLINVQVPENRFLAAADPIAFQFMDETNLPTRVRDFYSRSDGGSVFKSFNSGALRVRRQGWAEIGREAYRFCSTLTPETTLLPNQKFWDQDGLNAVASKCRLPMSLRWNFPIFMRNCGVERQLSPAVYHFMSNPKPWNGSFPPWNRSFTSPYKRLLNKYPVLVELMPVFSRSILARYAFQQRFKQIHEYIGWACSFRRDRILSYESNAIV